MKEKKCINYCWKKCRRLCNESFVPDCSPVCESYCLDKEASPSVPPLVMKTWENLYGKLMKGSDVGCQPYFAPPDPGTAQKITRRMHMKQTVYQDEVRKATLAQIKPEEGEEEVESAEEDPNQMLPICRLCSQADQDLMKLINSPPIEVAHRNYVGKHKGGRLEKEESTTKTPAAIPQSSIDTEKTVIINPDVKKLEFIEVAKITTEVEEEIWKGVEEMWSAYAPLLMEQDERQKKAMLGEINAALHKKHEIHKKENDRLIAEQDDAILKFERGLSAEMDKKYLNILEEMKIKLDKGSNYAIESLLKKYEEKNRFEIEWFRSEGVEKYQERVRIFTQFCNLWMRIMEAAEKRYHFNEKQLALKDSQLTADLQKMEEHRILKSVAELNLDHEIIQTALADFLYKRDQEIIRLKENVDELQKKVDIWKNLVNDLLTQFQKFVTFALNEKPVQTQYLLSLNELYNQFLEDYLKSERKLENVALQKMTADRVRALHPTCAPPDRLSRGSTLTADSSSTADTETEPKCVVPDYVMAAIAKGEFPQKPPSYDELAYRKEQELEAVVQTFGYEPSDNATWDTQSTQNFRDVFAQRATSPPEDIGVEALEENCEYMDEGTKFKVDEVLNLMHSRPGIMKNYIII